MMMNTDVGRFQMLSIAELINGIARLIFKGKNNSHGMQCTRERVLEYVERW